MTALRRYPRLSSIGLLLGLVGLVACSSGRTEEAKDEGHRSLLPHSEGVESIDALTDRSDLVVRGTVVAVDEGRQVEEDPGHSLGYNRVTVAVEATYWSRHGEAPAEIVLEQTARSGGETVDYAGLAPNVDGDEVLLFLKLVPAEMNAPGDVTYTITAGLGRFDIADDGSFTGPDADAAVIEEVESMSSSELESAVARVTS